MGNHLMSLIKANDITNVAGGIPTVKSQQLIPTAWVNFNGTGTVAIRDSEGISSITDDGTGRYTANFSSSMANADYSAVVSGNQSQYNRSLASTATSSFSVYVRNDAGTFTDAEIVTTIVMGGQS
jgi:hypothetical protein